MRYNISQKFYSFLTLLGLYLFHIHGIFMAQTIQKNHSSLFSRFFNIEMSAIILLFLCVIWFLSRDIWISDSQVLILADKDNIFQFLGFSASWYDFTARMVILYSIFTITLSLFLHTKEDIWVIPLFLTCTITGFLYYHTHDTNFLIPPVTLFSLFTLYIIGFERFFLNQPSFINHTLTIFLFSVSSFFSLEMSLGIMPVFVLTTLLCSVWKQHPASHLSGGCFMVLCGTICGIAGNIQFFGHSILAQDFMTLSLPIFWMGLCWAFYIFISPLFKNYKIPETLLTAFLSMMIFVCAIYIGHLDYMILNQA